MLPSKGLSLAARDHALDQSRTGRLGHDGSDGSDPRARIERHGTWEIQFGENIAYGSDEGRRIVVQLAIDDAVPSRGHRENLLRENFLMAGVAIESHPKFRHGCVIDYAGHLLDR